MPLFYYTFKCLDCGHYWVDCVGFEEGIVTCEICKSKNTINLDKEEEEDK